MENKVKRGKIKATRSDRSLPLSKVSIRGYSEDVTGKPLTEAEKKQIEKAVKKTVEEYGEVLRLLGKE